MVLFRSPASLTAIRFSLPIAILRLAKVSISIYKHAINLYTMMIQREFINQMLSKIPRSYIFFTSLEVNS